jgi:hypothetical protein
MKRTITLIASALLATLASLHAAYADNVQAAASTLVGSEGFVEGMRSSLVIACGVNRIASSRCWPS